MRMPTQPKVANMKDAVDHIQTLQSEQIVDGGKERIMREALEFYALTDDGATARRALELTR